MTQIMAPFSNILPVLAVALFVLAAVTDVATRTIPNTLCLGVLVLGLIGHLSNHTIGAALVGFGIVFALSFAVWSLGMFGGGDAKLLSAAALLVPAGGAADLVLLTALFGGVLSLFYIAASRLLPPIGTSVPVGQFSRILQDEQQRILCRESLPYAVAIGCGAIFVMFRH